MANSVVQRNWNSWVILRPASAAPTLAVMLVLGLVAIQSTQAQTYTVLYSFTAGSDGADPWAGVIRDSSGNLYGTTVVGGTSNSGTVFELGNTGIETVLHSFSGNPDGENPYGGVIRDNKGDLYGTSYGGSGPCSNYGSTGCGTVFKVSVAGGETVLYDFMGAPDGAYPNLGVIPDAAGNLYGTTYYGGVFGEGTVFKVTKKGKETVLYSFGTNQNDGSNPSGSVIRDSKGNLYGTTYYGPPANGGTVFKVGNTDKETVLYRFKGMPDGFRPTAGVIQDAKGDLYGTTRWGGKFNNGAVFKLGKTGGETVLYSFTGGSDGANPYASVIQDSKGNLYGTTQYGGDLAACSGGCGTVFRLNKTGKETVLYSFTGGTDGAQPRGELILDSKGNLYGTTTSGGTGCGSGCGVVFKLTP